jgi:hypothetical protein
MYGYQKQEQPPAPAVIMSVLRIHNPVLVNNRFSKPLKNKTNNNQPQLKPPPAQIASYGAFMKTAGSKRPWK